MIAYRASGAAVDVCVIDRPTPTNSLQRGFFGGDISFPGGIVHDDDSFSAWPRELIYPDGDFWLPDGAGWPGYNELSWALDSDGRSARVAAARYLLEQTGIDLTAVGDASREQLALFQAAIRCDVPELRRALKAQGRQLAIMGPTPLMRWLSPPTDSQAFDVRFFSFNCWSAWESLVDPPWEGEAADAPKTRWVSAASCLAAVRAGEQSLSPAGQEALIWLAETALSFDRGWDRCTNLHNGLVRCSREPLAIVQPVRAGPSLVLPAGNVPVPTTYVRTSRGAWLPASPPSSE